MVQERIALPVIRCGVVIRYRRGDEVSGIEDDEGGLGQARAGVVRLDDGVDGHECHKTHESDVEEDESTVECTGAPGEEDEEDDVQAEAEDVDRPGRTEENIFPGLRAVGRIGRRQALGMPPIQRIL